MKKSLLIAIGLLLSCFLSTSAFAYSIDSLFGEDYATSGQLDLLSDNSAEIWIDTNGSGMIDATDYLISVLSLESINNVPIGTGIYEEVSAIMAIEIDSSVYASTNVQGIDLYNYTASALEEADLAVIQAYSNLVYGIDLSSYLTFVDDSTTVEEVVALYVDETPDDDNRENDIATLLDEHTDGDLVMTLSVDTATDPTDGVAVTAPSDLSQVDPLPVQMGITGTSIYVNLTVTEDNWTNVDFENIYASSGGFSRASDDDAAHILDDISFSTDGKLVPEPATMSLFGFGLLSIAAYYRRRRI